MVEYCTMGTVKGVTIPVEFGYNQEDPFIIKLTFHLPDGEEVAWEVAFSLFQEILEKSEVGQGDIILRGTNSYVFINISSPEGEGIIAVSKAAVADFIYMTADDYKKGIEGFKISDEELQEWFA
jgi:hypothetical protein